MVGVMKLKELTQLPRQQQAAAGASRHCKTKPAHGIVHAI
jgi:hypothetical protein